MADSGLRKEFGRIDRYQTFFLCGTHWLEPQTFVNCVDWVVSQLKSEFVTGLDGGPACVLSATKPEDYGKRKPSFFGDYFKLYKIPGKEELESFFIGAGVNSQLYIRVEFLHLKKTVPAADGSSDQPAAEVPNGIRIVSMSIRKDLWQKCKESGLADEIIHRWEQLFITSGALYGYVTPTYFPRVDKFAQIHPELKPSLPDPEGRITARDAHTMPSFTRIIDFDYTKFVEGIYCLSYISKTQLENSGSRGRILGASGDVRSRILKDTAGNEVGVAVELKNDSDAAKQHWIELLGNLLWEPSDPRE